jgi:hypothetical protein
MKNGSQSFVILAAACAFAIAFPLRGAAQVSEEDFKALKKLVEQLNDKMLKLEQVHDQDQQTHSRDQQQIDQLKQQLGETQKTATDAQQKAQAAAQVQPTRPLPGEGNASHNFTMVGDAEVQFGKVDGSHSAFVLADFAPIFLFRARDNVLFEAGFDVTLQNNSPRGGSSTHVDMSFGQLDYLVNDWLTFVGGDMLLPLGTYSERAAGWINKIPDDPFVRDLVPGSGIGVQLRGAVPVGQSGESLNYSVYAVNGPTTSDTNGFANLGTIDFEGNVGDTPNFHGSPSAGGRLGWFHPLKAHYDLELGVSGQTGTWDDKDSRRWSAAVLDAAVHVSPFFEAKGEYIHSWMETDDAGTLTPRGWWVQAGYKLAGLDLELPLINNLELVGRYDKINDGAGTKTDRYTVGYVYYITNTLLFQGDYEFLHSNDPSQGHNMFVFQIAYGF